MAQAKIKLTGIKTDDLVAQKAQLTQQIAQYNAQVADTQTKLVSLKDDLDVTNTLLADAKNCVVDTWKIGSPGLSAENLSDVKFQALPVTVSVDGDLDHIAAFVYSLKQIFPTSYIKSVKIGADDDHSSSVPDQTPDASPPGPTPTPSPTSTPTPARLTYQADINFVIYNYKGE